MTITVTSPMGHEVEFPDGTDPATINDVMSKHFSEQPVSLGGLGAAAGTGLVKGTTSGIGMLGDVGAAVRSGAARLGVDPDVLKTGLRGLPGPFGIAGRLIADQAAPTSQQLQTQAERITGPMHVAGNVPEKYAETAASFVPGAVLNPETLGGSLGRTALKAGTSALGYGVAPGVASEAAGQALQGTPYEEPARAAGALATGGGVGYLGSRTAQQILREEMPRWVTKEHVDQAEQLIKFAQRQNPPIPLTWPMALSHVTDEPINLATQRLLETHPLTRGQMGSEIYALPQRFDINLQRQLGEMAPPPQRPTMLGPQAAQAAGEALAEPQDILNRGTRPMYQAAEQSKVNPADLKSVQTLPGYSKIASDLRKGDKAALVAHLPDDSVGFLDEAKKELQRQGDNLIAATDNTRDMRLGYLYHDTARQVRDTAAAASPVYAEALRIQRDMRQRFIEPLQNSPLADIANSKETSQAIDALFPAHPHENSHAEVTETVSRLANKNPLVASQLVRMYLGDAFSKAMTSSKYAGPGRAWGPSGWFKAIAGDPQQYENLRAAVEALPNGKARWAGLGQLIETAGATGRRLPIGSPTASALAEEAGLKRGGKIAGTAKLAFSPGKWLDFANEMIGNWQAANNAEDLVRIITDPRAGDTFRALTERATTPERTRAYLARALAQTWRPLPGIETRAKEKAQQEISPWQ